jgi:hypothetical protein
VVERMHKKRRRIDGLADEKLGHKDEQKKKEQTKGNKKKNRMEIRNKVFAACSIYTSL